VKRRVLSMAIVFVLSLLVYWTTLAPTITAGDSGELAAAALHQGVPHPPGYPLFCVVGKLFTFLPLRSPAFDLNLMSAVLFSSSSSIICLLLFLLGQPAIAAVSGGLVFAFSGTAWSQGSSAEVYGIYVLTASLIVLASLLWARGRSLRHLVLLGYLVGLGLAAHLGTLMLIPGLLLLVLFSGSEGEVTGGERRLVVPLLFLVLAVSVYLYLPFASLHDPPLDWGDPETPGRFLGVVSGRAHRSAAVAMLPPSATLRRLGGLLAALARDFSFVLPFAAIGLWSLVRRRDWWLARVIGAFILFDFIYALWLNVVPLEATPFLLVTGIVIALLAGIGMGALAQLGGRSPLRGERMLVSILVLLVPCGLAATNYARVDRSNDFVAYDFGKGVLASLEEGAVFFAEGDNISFPVYYLTMVEGERPDITIYDREGVVEGTFYVSVPAELRGDARERARVAVEVNFLDSTDMPVYYASDRAYRGLVELGYGMVPWGLCYRVVRLQETLTGLVLPPLPALRNLEDEDTIVDFMSRDLLVIYHMRRGAQLLIQNDTTGAHAEYRTAGALAEGNVWAMNSVGVDLLNAGWVEEAAPYFEQAVARSTIPRADYYFNLGLARLQLHDPGAALGPLRRAFELDPLSIDIRYNLGAAYGWLGDHASAREQFIWVVSRSPDDASALLNLALADASLGRVEEASAAFARAVSLDPSIEGARRLFDAALARGAAENGSAPMRGGP
jgi:Flp pilus assembly protein TadD